MMETTTNEPTFWFTGWLPNGFKCSFTMPVNMDTAFEQAMAFTNMLIVKGFSQHEPGLVDGEQRETVGWITRRSKVNDDGTETPVLDVYIDNDKLTYKFISVYLNTSEDHHAFWQASGLMIDALPLWESNHLERGNPKTDKYIIRVPRPFSVISEANQYYNPDEPDIKKRKPKRLFVRWETANNILPLDTSQNGTKSNEKALSSDLPPEEAIPLVTSQIDAETAKRNLAGNRAPANGKKNLTDLPNGFAMGTFKTTCLKDFFDGNTKQMNTALQPLFDKGLLPPSLTLEQALDVVRNRKDDVPTEATG